jgi:type II secretory pathway pseudopilin PulG
MRKYAFEIAAFIVLSTLLAIVAVPNLLVARQRSRQKQTLADIRTLAQAIEARATDENTYALWPESVPRRVTLDDLERALAPKYIKRIPRHDQWGNELDVFLGADEYIIRSRGSDGVPEGSSYRMGYTTRFEHDLAFSEGTFIRAPYVSSTQ